MSNEIPIILSNYNTTNSKTNQLNLVINPILPCFNKEIALESLFINYSWRNVSTYFSNNTVSYIFNGVTRNITIPDGYYDIKGISDYLQIRMSLFGDCLVDSSGNNVYYLKIQPNSIYYAATLTCTPLPISLPTGWTNPNSVVLSGNCPQLLVSNATFGQLIGFGLATFPSVSQSSIYQINSTFVPQINPVSVVNVCCNMVGENSLNVYPDVIHTFSSSGYTYGSQIPVEPKNRVWFPVANKNYNNITLTLRDSQNRDLQVVDPVMTAVLIIRNKRDVKSE